MKKTFNHSVEGQKKSGRERETKKDEDAKKLKKGKENFEVARQSSPSPYLRQADEEAEVETSPEKKNKKKRRKRGGEEEESSRNTTENWSQSSSTTTSSVDNDGDSQQEASKEEREEQEQEENRESSSSPTGEGAPATTSGTAPSTATAPSPSDPYLLAEANYLRTESRWLNRQRVLILASRGITHIQRHLMEDFKKLLPHHKAEVRPHPSIPIYLS